MTVRLASLEGDHVLLSVLASEIKAGDLKISGHMVRRFLDDGCARFVVLRRRDEPNWLDQ